MQSKASKQAVNICELKPNKSASSPNSFTGENSLEIGRDGSELKSFSSFLSTKHTFRHSSDSQEEGLRMHKDSWSGGRK